MHAAGWVVVGVVSLAAVGGLIYAVTRPAKGAPVAPKQPGAPVVPNYPTHSSDPTRDLAGIGQAIPAIVGIVGMFI